MKRPGREVTLSRRRGYLRRWPVSLGVLTLQGLASACSSAGSKSDDPRRPVGTAPVQLALAEPVSPGRAEAFFKLDTGGDQLTERPVEARLIVVVRFERTEYRQTLAACRKPGLGSALGGGTERELEVAICDGEYWLVAEPGSVRVLRMDAPHANAQVARFDLPPGVTAVSPAAK